MRAQHRKKEGAPRPGKAPSTTNYLPTKEPRKIARGVAWCWQEKAARRQIRIACDGNSSCVYALGVYDALAEIASDCNKGTFRTGQAHIAEYAGCGVTRVKQCLELLEKIDLIKVETEGIKSWNCYTLLSAIDSRNATKDSRNTTILSREKKSGTAKVSRASKNGVAATVEESVEKSLEEGEKQTEKKVVVEVRPAAARQTADPHTSCSASLLGQTSLGETELAVLDSTWSRPTLDPESVREVVELVIAEVGYDQLLADTQKWADHWRSLDTLGVRSLDRSHGYDRFLREKYVQKKKFYLGEPPELPTRSSGKNSNRPRRQVGKEVLRDDQGWEAPSASASALEAA